MKLSPVGKPPPSGKPLAGAKLTPEELARMDAVRAEKIRKWEAEQAQRAAAKEPPPKA